MIRRAGWELLKGIFYILVIGVLTGFAVMVGITVGAIFNVHVIWYGT